MGMLSVEDHEILFGKPGASGPHGFLKVGGVTLAIGGWGVVMTAPPAPPCRVRTAFAPRPLAEWLAGRPDRRNRRARRAAS